MSRSVAHCTRSELGWNKSCTDVNVGAHCTRSHTETIIATEWISLQNRNVGMVITNFDLRIFMLNKVTCNTDRCNLLCIVS